MFRLNGSAAEMWNPHLQCDSTSLQKRCHSVETWSEVAIETVLDSHFQGLLESQWWQPLKVPAYPFLKASGSGKDLAATGTFETFHAFIAGGLNRNDEYR